MLKTTILFRLPSAPVTVGAALLLSLGFAPGSAQAPPRDLVIRNVRIFDGVRLIPTGTVIVQGGRITHVGGTSKPLAGAEIVDGDGSTLLPGFIDCHTHAYGQALEQAIAFGVTTELDMFTDHAFAAGLRKEQADGGAPTRADLFSAGTLVTAPGGHGTQYGMTIPTIDSQRDARAFVDARIAEGSDYIKIVYDDGKTYGIHFPTITKETMAAVVAAAHERGKLAVVHIGSMAGARDAIESGADGLAHLFEDAPMDAPLARLAAERRAFVIPTLTVLESVTGVASGASLVDDPALARALSLADAANLQRAFPAGFGSLSTYAYAEASIRQMKAAGVAILAGSDAPNPGTAHGVSLHRELELLVKAGLTPVEALAAATSVPADRFGLSDRGRVVEGRRGDLLLVSGDPTRDILATRRITRIWKNGVAVDREAYIASIERGKAEAESLLAQPEPLGAASGLVSDFEDGTSSSTFGSGWAVSTDAIAGGTSVGSLEVVEGGASGSRRSLSITGDIRPDVPYAWAGAMFFPGSTPMSPTNLSGKNELSFWAKGDGKVYRVMFFAASRGSTPAIQKFEAGPEWKAFTFPFTAFDGMNGSDLTGIFFGGGPGPGRFELRIDDVRLGTSPRAD
jgi:imidazolonepropionase-like amidohydrolase